MENKAKQKKDTLIIIPAFNEEKSLPLVLQNIPMERVLEVVVVNNASTDKTPELARANGARVLDEPQQGYGKACLTGLSYGFKQDVSYIAFLDGDFSDNPQELNLLLQEIDQGHDLVIGSRTLGKAQKGALLPQAIFGNFLSTWLMKIFFGGFSFSDLGPFRIIRKDKLKELNMRDEDFGWTVEMQAKALIHQLSCSEVSVSYKKRIGVSKITGTIKGTFKAGHKILWTIFSLWTKSLFQKRGSKVSRAEGNLK
jgi:glycosyltransferase involved in cell wall biosynthesis